MNLIQIQIRPNLIQNRLQIVVMKMENYREWNANLQILIQQLEECG